jgi:glycosyltransferase involved in cell wall biosynthesis
MLRRAIDIIIAQTFKEWELIIVNDGHDEDIRRIVFSYSDKVTVSEADGDAKIRYTEHNRHNGGAGIGRNVGLRLARGEFVFFHDHDDFFYSRNGSKFVLEEMFSQIDEDTDILFFNILDLNKPSKYVTYTKFNPIDISKPLSTDDINVLTTGSFLKPLPFPTWNKIIRRKFLIDNDLHYSEDLIITDIDFYFKIIFATSKIKFIDNILYWHYENNNSLMHDNSIEFYKEFKMFENIKKYLIKYGVYEYLRLVLINLFIEMFQARFDLGTAKNPLVGKKFVRKYLKLLDLTVEDLDNFDEHHKRDIIWLM